MTRDESAYWNDDAGPRWALDADRLDAQLEPIGHATLDAADLAPGQRVVDVGCGAGWLTTAAARRVAPDGSAVGLDVAGPLLAVARRRAACDRTRRVEFLHGDAETTPLGPPSAAFDRVVSRLGVMFFSDTVSAFRNLARGMRPGGRLTFACWGHPADNPWMSVPRAAAARHVDLPRQIDPATDDEPGPFRLADARRTTATLAAAGFGEITVADHAGTFLVGGPGSLDDVAGFCMRVGPAASATRDAEPATRRAVAAAVREALEPYAGQDGVRMGYRSLLFGATAPAEPRSRPRSG